jgi:hypothetical protein
MCSTLACSAALPPHVRAPKHHPAVHRVAQPADRRPSSGSDPRGGPCRLRCKRTGGRPAGVVPAARGTRAAERRDRTGAHSVPPPVGWAFAAVFLVDALDSPSCYGSLPIVAAVTESTAVERILRRLRKPSPAPHRWPLRDPRAGMRRLSSLCRSLISQRPHSWWNESVERRDQRPCGPNFESSGRRSDGRP